MDRVDIRIVVDPPTAFDLDYNSPRAEDSDAIRFRVESAIQRAQHRLKGTPWNKNAEIPSSAIRELFPLRDESNKRLNTYLVTSRSSARGIDRIARLAWTVADLNSHPYPEITDVETAIKLREADGRWLN
jgi:magnesium chelatase family protein